ncbi:MAG: PilW family protein [Colwellia sp.]|nr:PilW family protein [Colwellia sp.]
MKNRQQGFTLIEIIISLSIGLVLFGGIMSVFVGMRTTTQETNSLGAMQENGRFALNIISDDLMRLNFWGDFPITPTFSDTVGIGLPVMPIAGDCTGEGLNNSSFPQNVNSAFKVVWGVTTSVANPNPMNCIDDARANSDILQLKRVQASPLPPQAGGAPSNPPDDRYWLNTNTGGGFIFPGTVAVPFVGNSRLWEYQHHVYYVRDENQGDFTVPVLMQGTLSNGGANLMDFQPLIEGIEAIHFMYGVDTDDTDGVLAIDAYLSAAQMSISNYWNAGAEVLAVKVYILARDILPDNDFTNTNTYRLGNLVLVPNDNFRRLLLVSTVALHNVGIEEWTP